VPIATATVSCLTAFCNFMVLILLYYYLRTWYVFFT